MTAAYCVSCLTVSCTTKTPIVAQQVSDDVHVLISGSTPEPVFLEMNENLLTGCSSILPTPEVLPSLLAEFSTVVADTQQYIVTDVVEQQVSHLLFILPSLLRKIFIIHGT